MNILKPVEVAALPADFCSRYRGLAFDGCSFYLTLPQDRRIDRFTHSFEPDGCRRVNRAYTCICYDSTEHCFWACTDNSCAELYQLDCSLREIDRMLLPSCAGACSRMTGLSYNCANNTLLAAFPDLVVEITKDGACGGILQDVSAGICVSVLSISPYYIIVRRCVPEQELSLFSSDGSLVSSFCVPADYLVEDLVYDPCGNAAAATLRFRLLATKKCCYPKILVWELAAGDLTLDACNSEICDGGCCPCGEGKCACDLIESVALAETALSHILNAEGEKMQKAVETAGNVCQLLEIDRSVNRTILNVTQLEQLLYAKLSVLNDLRGAPCCDQLHGDGVLEQPKA